MNMLLSYINWNPDIEAFNLFGFSVRYYALGWIFGFAASYYMVRRQYRDLRISDEKFDPVRLLLPGHDYRVAPGPLPVLRRATLLQQLEAFP